MIARIAGVLESVDGNVATLRPRDVAAGGFDVTLEVLLPAYLASELAASAGKPVTFWTMVYLEGQGQGTSFLPRVLGFGSAREREFFELFTTVKGIGNRRALRALTVRPGAIASAVVRADAKALTQLPEVGKRLAETIIAELKGKIDSYADLTADVAGAAGGPARAAVGALSATEEDAVAALMNLGQTRAEAERNVARVIARDPAIAGDSGALIRAVFAAGAR